jgi:hypothetical protein
VTTWDETPCNVCRGTGKTFLQHEDGSLSEDVCPYCHGRGDAVWVHEHRVERRTRLATAKGYIWGATGLYVLTIGWPLWRHSFGLKWVHGLMALAILVALVWVFMHPSGKPKRRGPNPLTSDRERWMGAAVMGGAMLKGQWQRRR